MLHELRIYNAVPGKLSELHARFRDHTNAIFAKHGFKPVGYWTNLIGPSNQQLIYILEWEDLAHCEEAWEAFKADPEWIAVKSASEKDGPLVADLSSSILQPTDYSLMR
jgi:hypothetical protein